MDMTVDDKVFAQYLSQMSVCGVITSVDQCALRARSKHGVHHAIVEVNIVIGVLVVHCELHVVVRVHVPLVVVCDEAVVRRTLGLIALVVGFVFVVAIFHGILLYGRYTLYSNRTFATSLFRFFVGLNCQPFFACERIFTKPASRYCFAVLTYGRMPRIT